MTNREDFEKWCGDTSWTPYQKSIMFLAWQEQQKKIDELEQQRDEMLKIMIKLDETWNPHPCRTANKLLIEKITGLKMEEIIGMSWEQIKAGKR